MTTWTVEESKLIEKKYIKNAFLAFLNGDSSAYLVMRLPLSWKASYVKKEQVIRTEQSIKAGV